jgi:hypothetical protein
VSDALEQSFLCKCGEASAETRSTHCIDRMDQMQGTTDREAGEESPAYLALDLLAYPRPKPVYDDTYDGLEDEEASILYQRINYPSPPRDMPEFDECGNPLEEEEDDEWYPWAL